MAVGRGQGLQRVEVGKEKPEDGQGGRWREGQQLEDGAVGWGPLWGWHSMGKGTEVGEAWLGTWGHGKA